MPVLCSFLLYERIPAARPLACHNVDRTWPMDFPAAAEFSRGRISDVFQVRVTMMGMDFPSRRECRRPGFNMTLIRTQSTSPAYLGTYFCISATCFLLLCSALTSHSLHFAVAMRNGCAGNRVPSFLLVDAWNGCGTFTTCAFATQIRIIY